MVQVSFSSALQRHVPCPALSVEARTVREALEEAFAREPRLRGYLLDDQGALRKHMAVFVDGFAVKDRRRLGDPVGPDGEIAVIQALSGG
ncbi:MAG: MoaD/ThiS family protein [Gemmatimonadales bacterium]